MHPSEVNMRLLQVFEGVYRTRSVSRAAEELQMSQPAISLALGKLRTHFKDRLFVRTSAGMEATPFALQLISSVQGSLHLLEQTMGTEKEFDPGTSGRRFTICMTDITEMVVLPHLLRRFKREAPNISLAIQRITDQTPRALETGEVDLVVGYVPSVGTGVYQKQLLMRDFVCIASGNHPRIRRALSLAAFNAEGHLVVTASGSGLRYAEEVLAASKIHRRILLRVPDLLGVDRLIEDSDLIATVPRPVGRYLALDGRVKMFEHPVDLPSYPVMEHWHERFHLDPSNQWLRRLVAEIMNPEAQLI